MRSTFLRYRLVFALLLGMPGGLVLYPSNCPASAQVEQSSAQPALQQLESAITERSMKVSEFRFIREEAERLGLRAWLFGGTAAGYAHYVKWDLLRESGDRRYQPDRFDYDYTNIYRSTQDLDIVIDGTPQQAAALQQRLAEAYPHLQGSKSAWEVRLLRQSVGDKQALLNNPDFLNQHTDSNSTGMIELTLPPKGEGAVRDLRDWSAKEPHFLKDVREGALHYYYSAKHGSTSLFREGRNPPILSVIRYLTKAFQYELKLRPEDLAQIRKLVAEFNPNANLGSYVSDWIERNGKKLFQNAVNLEYAARTLNELGLRKKLMAIRGDSDKLDSLAWWMNKAPLESKPLGTKGRTAAEVFGRNGWAGSGEPLVVAHETNSFQSWESITRAHTGDPNVLQSREGLIGEAAVYGDGFYTQVGRSGARGTGLTIRFMVDPNAREGSDFASIENGRHLLILNKNAIRVIPESLNFGPVEYFRFLLAGEGLDVGDKAILEKLKRRVESKLQSLSDSEYREIRKTVEAALPDFQHHIPVIEAWVRLPKSAQYSQGLFNPAIRADGVHDRRLLELVYSKPAFQGLPEAEQVRISGEKQLAVEKLLMESWHDDRAVDRIIRENPREAYAIGRSGLFPPGDYYYEMSFKLALKVVSQSRDPLLIDELITRINALSKASAQYDKERASEYRAILFDQVFRKHMSQDWAPQLKKLMQGDRAVVEDLYGHLIEAEYPLDEDTLIAYLDFLKNAKSHEIDGYYFNLEKEVFSKSPGKNSVRALRQALRNMSYPDHASYRTAAKYVDRLLDNFGTPEEREREVVALLRDLNQASSKSKPDFLIERIARKYLPDPDALLFELFMAPERQRWGTTAGTFILGRPIDSAEMRESVAKKALEMINQADPHLDFEVFAKLFNSKWSGNVELIRALGARFGDSEKEFWIRLIKWRGLPSHLELLDPALQSDDRIIWEILEYFFKDPRSEFAWKSLVKFVERFPERDETYKELLNLPHWKGHPELRKLCNGKAPSLSCLHPEKYGLLGRCKTLFRSLVRMHQ